MTTKIKSKSKAKIEENIGNNSFSTTGVDTRTGFEPYQTQKSSPLGKTLKKTENLVNFVKKVGRW